MVRRVSLAEVLIERTLDRRPAEDCGRETPIAAGFEDQICAFLNYPTVCPHGRPIAGIVEVEEGGGASYLPPRLTSDQR